MLKSFLQEMVIIIFRPWIVREMWGWGRVYHIFVGGYQRNWFWKHAKKRRIRGKLNGFMMDLDLSDWCERSTFFLGRWYELSTQKLLKQVLKKGDEVIDIGANVGMFSLTARHIVGEEGIIYAFEPNPSPRKQLNRNIEINQIENIRVYPVGLGETDGKFTLHVPYINSGEGSLAPINYEDGKWYAIPVEVKVGDDLLQHTAPRLIKIDVEGAEINVIKGISKLIDKQRPLIIAECIPAHLNRFDSSVEDLLSVVYEHSYKAFQISLAKTTTGYELSLIPIKDLKVEKNCNILFGHVDDPYIKGRFSEIH